MGVQAKSCYTALKIPPAPIRNESPVADTTFEVPEMSCGHCVSALNDAVADVEGVESVDVDLASKLVDVEGSADEEAVRQAIEAAGYEVAAR